MYTGIDIGSYSIKVVQVARTLGGGVRVIGAAKWLLDKEVMKARVAELESGTTSSEIQIYLSSVLKQIFQPGRISPRRCVIGVGGRELNLRTTLVPPVKTLSKLHKLMGYELGEVAGKSGAEVYQDFSPLKFPLKKYAEMPVLVGLAKRSYLDERLKMLYNLGISIKDIYAEPVALMSALAIQRQMNLAETALLMDIGANNINVIIHQGGNLIFARNISGGGMSFTRAIKEMLNVTFEQAELLKITEANLAMAHRSRTNPINSSVLSAVGQIHSIYQSSLSVSRTQLKSDEIEIDRVLISGGGARIKGFGEHLSSVINKPVEIFNPFKETDVSAFNEETKQKVMEEPTDMAIALGLACSAMSGREGVKISFLPPALKKKKTFYRETVYVIAGVVLVILSSLILVVSALREKGQVANELNILKPQQEQLSVLKSRFNEAMKKKERVQSEYQAYLSEVENGVFFANTLMVISQMFPAGAKLSEMTLGKTYQLTNPSRTVYDPNVIILSGYLIDDTALETFRQFRHNVNNNTVYPLTIDEKEEQLTPVEGVTAKGKWKFDMVIRKGNKSRLQ